MVRPQKYDREDILNRMKFAFWESGYADISMDDIDRITEMKRGSIYNAFTDKRGLYLETLEYYGNEYYGGAVEMINSADTPKAALSGLYDAAFVEMKGDNPRWGCFMCNAAVEIAPTDPKVAVIVAKYINMLTSAFVVVLESASKPGTSSEQLKKLAENLTATYIGFNVMVRTQMSMASLKRVSESSIDLVSNFDI